MSEDKLFDGYLLPYPAMDCMFPDDTIWLSAIAEIVGYSKRYNVHVVIDDGNCLSSDGTFVFHVYRPDKPEEHLKNFIPDLNKYPLKYIGREYKIMEERVDVYNQEELKRFRNKLQETIKAEF